MRFCGPYNLVMPFRLIGKKVAMAKDYETQFTNYVKSGNVMSALCAISAAHSDKVNKDEELYSKRQDN